MNGVGIQDNNNHLGFKGQGTVLIGQWSSYYYNGSIDELQIFNSALSDDQVAGLFNNYASTLSIFTPSLGPNNADCINGGARVSTDSSSFNCSCSNGLIIIICLLSVFCLYITC